MSSRCRERAASLVFACLLVALAPPALARELVVCADPDDLPYSSRDETGFENKIARVIAEEMGAALRYTWQPLRRGLVRKTLDAGACDMLVGVPAGRDDIATTAPYYRSAFAFVYPRDDRPIGAFDDPRLRRATIGVQLVGGDNAATPAALALARRGIVDNVIGFPVYGATPSAQRMIDALDAGRLDVALIWGPQAGYFARRARHPVTVTLARDDASQRMDFAIAIGVRKDALALRDELDRALDRTRDRIDAILTDYAVPVIDRSTLARGPLQ